MHARIRQMRPRLVALLLGALIVIVSGCSAFGAAHTAPRTDTATRATTPNATQTAVAQPTSAVSVVVLAQEQGVIANHNVSLKIQVAATNGANRPIEITYPCGYDPIQFAVAEQATGHIVYFSDTYSCPPSLNRLYPPAVATGATYTYPLTADFSQTPLAPGQYVVKITFFWQDAQDTGLATRTPELYGQSNGQTTLILR